MSKNIQSVNLGTQCSPAIGYQAGSVSQLSNVIAIGQCAGTQSQGANSIAIGSSINSKDLEPSKEFVSKSGPVLLKIRGRPKNKSWFNPTTYSCFVKNRTYDLVNNAAKYFNITVDEYWYCEILSKTQLEKLQKEYNALSMLVVDAEVSGKNANDQEIKVPVFGDDLSRYADRIREIKEILDNHVLESSEEQTVPNRGNSDDCSEH